MESKSFSLNLLFVVVHLFVFKPVWLTRYRQEIRCLLVKCVIANDCCLTFTSGWLIGWLLEWFVILLVVGLNSASWNPLTCYFYGKWWSCFSYLHLLLSYPYQEPHSVLSRPSGYPEDATALLKEVAHSSIRAQKWVSGAVVQYMLTRTGGTVGGIPHASCPDCAGRGKDKPGVVIKMNALWSMLPCPANWAALNIAWSCLTSKAKWIVKQFGLKDPAKDDLQNHGISWSLLWMSR